MNDKNLQKIIIAPLNWGLGHASRCVPIIIALLENNFIPILASDGNSLAYLQKEFPTLETLKLPSYTITYGKNVKWGLLLQAPKIWKAIKEEQKLIEEVINNNTDIVGLISDNRFGIRSNKVPSVYITHQINVLSGFTTFITSKIHQNIVKKFDECWIPDKENSEFSGKLSLTKKNFNQKFIGPLSRFRKEKKKKNIDILIILSGPEPNRSSLEKKLKKEFANYNRSIVLIQGKIENQQLKLIEKNITVYNFMLLTELQNTINSSKIVVCRSGYSSIMDLAVLEKKVFFIPTKNQTEQEYLAKHLSERKLAPFCKKEDFTFDKLSVIENYTGLTSRETKLNSKLFCLFERKRKIRSLPINTF